MTIKPPVWCPRCCKAHSGTCPKRKSWDKAATGKPRSGRGGRPWQKRRQRIFERDDYLCQIHLKQGLYVPVELHGPNHGVCDHIVPLAEGGSDDDENLQTICQACDKVKTQAESMRGRGY